MEQEKDNNKGVIALLVVLVVILAVLCVLFATGTISLSNKDSADNIIDKTSVETDRSDTTSATTDNLKWSQYILSQDITKIEVATIHETTTISLDELKEVLPKFDDTKLIKTWYYAMGGDADATYLKISYKNNNNEYVLSIATAKHDPYNHCAIYKGHEILDKSLSSILENSIIEEKNVDMKESGTFFYEFDGCDGNMLKKFISNN